ncbi:hypothetical protein FH972_014843 [Carpinus fangiana]|uniref:Uncharacterized protein n=1 Tax=Carpinus fangiana TaxID=176857 RepID=A0A5N6RBK7_9ROSI|nr:hypothetical protein FH972_014843 [Carpinus fangiana]
MASTAAKPQFLRISIPSDFSTTMEVMNSKDLVINGSCYSAFLVEEEWFKTDYLTTLSPYVPVVLEWWIPYIHLTSNSH